MDIDGHFHRGFITDRHFTFASGFPVETGLVHPTELDAETQVALYGERAPQPFLTASLR